MAPNEKILAACAEEPEKEHAEEVEHYHKTLEKNKQISHKPGPLTGDETHRETTDEKGEKRIERERFSAI